MTSRELMASAAMLVVGVAGPWALALGEYHSFVLCMIGVYGIGSMGLTVLIGHGGMISLGHAGFAAVGAYTAALLMIRLDVSFWLALPASGVVGAVCGLLLGGPMLRLSGPYLAMATFGFSVVVPEIVGRWPSFDIGDPNFFGGALGLSAPDPSFARWPLDSSRRFWFVVLGTLIVGLIAAQRLLQSRWGSSLRAYRDAPVAAAAYGVDTRRVRIAAFGVAGAFAGVAGGLLAHLLGVLGPGTFSLTMSLTFLTAIVLGGVTSPWGALTGSTAVVVLQEWLTGRTSNLQLWYGAVLLVAVVLTRGGITGGVTWLWGLAKQRRSPGHRRALDRADARS